MYLEAKSNEQVSHLNGRAPLCTFRWSSTKARELYCLLQYTHSQCGVAVFVLLFLIKAKQALEWDSKSETVAKMFKQALHGNICLAAISVWSSVNDGRRIREFRATGNII